MTICQKSYNFLHHLFVFALKHIALVFFNGPKSRKIFTFWGQFSWFFMIFRFLKKCLAHKPWPKVDVEELEDQNWTAWGWDILKREKIKMSSKKVFFLKKNPITFFNKSKNFKKSLFQKTHFFWKPTSLKKVTFLKIFDFWKNTLDFFSRKKSFFDTIFMFPLFIISHPQLVQFWASNSSTSTFGCGLCARQNIHISC